MSAGFPLRSLLLLRERRETMAMQVVASMRAVLNSRRMDAEAVRSKLAEVEQQRRETLFHLASAERPDGIPAFQALRFRDHAEWLRDREAALQEEVEAAQHAVDAALNDVTTSQCAYRREHARRESVDLQKAIWKRNQAKTVDRQEQGLVEELLANRIGQRGRDRDN